ncbi:MAG: CapA family protein [Victivallales bacterium]|nr:CapA family protein [Victivallales bacterium]
MTTKPFELLITGDLAPIRHFATIIEKEPMKVYGDLLPIICHADYRIANLESTLVGQDFIVKSGAAFAGKPLHLPVLTQVPFDAVTLANNHTLDTGREHLGEFLQLLHNAGLSTVGAGLTQRAAETPLVIHHGDLSIIVFNMSEGEDMMAATGKTSGVAGWDVQRLCAKIRHAKASGKFNAIIVIVHCGLEYYPFPPMYVYDAFKCIAEAGADVIAGHHVHVPQGMAKFGKTPAYFSLGNFVFYQENQLLHRKTGYMLKIRIGSKGVLGTEIIPYRIGSDNLRLLSEPEAKAFQRVFSKLSTPLASRQAAELAWHACLKWYGVEGFRKELQTILDKFDSEPQKGAAMLRNRVNCMQHRMQWTDGLSDIVSQNKLDIPKEYLTLVNDYFTETLS